MAGRARADPHHRQADRDRPGRAAGRPRHRAHFERAGRDLGQVELGAARGCAVWLADLLGFAWAPRLRLSAVEAVCGSPEREAGLSV